MSRSSSIRNTWFLYLAGDVFAITAAYFTTLWIRFYSTWGRELFDYLNRLLGIEEPGDLGAAMQLFYAESAPRIVLFLCLTVCFLYAFRELYAGRRFLLRRPVTWSVVVANAIALALFYCYFYARRNLFHPRTVFATIMLLNIVYCVALRALVDRILRLLRAGFDTDDHGAVLVGSGDDAELLNELIERTRPHGLRVMDRIRVDPEEKWAAVIERVSASVRQRGAQMIICADRSLEISRIMEILQLCEELNVSIKVLSDKLDVIVNEANLPVDMIHGAPLVHFAEPSGLRGLLALKQALSIVSACAAMVVLSPLLLLIALLVRLTSSGPALFVQERVGINRKPFKMYKFRTMHQLADELQAEVERFNESGTGLFKIRKDPRVTLVGRFLRRFSLDELPQLINVIRGEMTLVGPRPLPWRDFEHYYEEWHYGRHGGLPGLTCLWQVSGRSDISFHNMCILDIYYLRNQTTVLDLKILLKTVWVVLFAKGAY